MLYTLKIHQPCGITQLKSRSLKWFYDLYYRIKIKIY